MLFVLTMLRPLGMCEGLRAPVDADDEDADVDEVVQRSGHSPP